MGNDDQRDAGRRIGLMSLLILALTAALVAVAPAVGSSGGPTAVAAKKKKYKKALWSVRRSATTSR
jgi:hypothetical protein